VTLTPTLRKFALLAHVTASVGWIGAVAVFLALSVAGLISPDAQIVRAAYVAMVITWSVIVPFCVASLLTGLVSSLGTEWGLFRNYWVMTKLLITLVATFGLVVHTTPINYIGGMAAQMTFSAADLLQTRVQLVVVSALALLALLVANVLSVYKPRGVTPYGWRKQRERSTAWSASVQAAGSDPLQSA
jgi:hypothetical protein